MYNARKNRIQQRQNWIWAMASITLFIDEFILCRYVFFDAHGMKDFPVVLGIFGGVALLLCLVFRKRVITLAVVLGYLASFAVGFLLHGYGTDAGGGRTSSFWLLWLFAYIGFLALGIFIEILLIKHKNKSAISP